MKHPADRRPDRRPDLGDLLIFTATAAAVAASFAADEADAYFFPRLIAVVLSGLCVIRIIALCRQAPAPFTDRPDFRRIVPALAVIAAYLLTAEHLGLYTATAAIFFALSTLYAEHPRRNLIKRFILALIVALALYAIFSLGMGVQAPSGWLV